MPSSLDEVSATGEDRADWGTKAFGEAQGYGVEMLSVFVEARDERCTEIREGRGGEGVVFGDVGGGGFPVVLVSRCVVCIV